MYPTRFSIALGAALVLGACSDEPEIAEGSDGRSASGEVLEGTISDDMLALDKVRSQAPLLQKAEGVSAGGEAAPSAASEDSTEEPDPEEAQAAEPEPGTFDEAFSAED